MSESKKRAYETSSEEDSVLASKGSATAIKRKEVPFQKFLPAYHEAYPCLVPSNLRKGSELVLCTTCKSDFHGSQFDCKQPVESKSYKEFKATGKFFSSFRSVSFSLSPPFSLSLVLMQQTYSFSALVNIDITSLYSISPLRKFVAHTVVRSRKIVLGVGRLWLVLFVHRGGGGGGGGLHITLGDWQTDLYNCTLILSQAVGFAIFPHSHVHSPARDLNRSTPLVRG